MFVYKVIPLTKLPRPIIQSPTYFSGDKFAVGQLVEVPLGRRAVPAVVVSVENAEQKKQEIKRSSFQLKNINKELTAKPIFSRNFLEAVIYLANYYYEPTGLMLKRMLPNSFSKVNRPLLSMLSELPLPSVSKNRKVKKTLILSKNRDEYYRKITKNKKSIFLVPEYIQLKKVKNILPKEDSIFLDEKTTQAKLRDAWGECYSGNIKNISGTRSALFVPVRDLDQIILENQNNTSYVSWDQHPKFDGRYAAEILGEKLGAHIVEGDLLPELKTYWKAQKQKWEIIRDDTSVGADVSIVDMREELKNGNFSIISEALRNSIRSLKENEKMFLFISRRGVASAIVCRDCGYIPRCPECDSALVLHNYKSSVGDRALICHHCGIKKVPPTACPSCGGKRIKLIGGGTQLAVEQIERIAPNLKIARIDADVVDGAEEAEKILTDFSKNKYNILVGTQLALKEDIIKNVDRSGIIMADTIINLPLYDASERIFNILWRLKHITEKEVLAQTYHPELSPFKYAEENNFEGFFSEEMKKRKLLSLPPYSHIIRLSYSHRNKEKVEQEAHALKKKLLVQFENASKTSVPDTVTKELPILGPAPAFREKVRGKYIWYMLIKWPVDDTGNVLDMQLRNKLLHIVPGDWEIVVEPIDMV